MHGDKKSAYQNIFRLFMFENKSWYVDFLYVPKKITHQTHLWKITKWKSTQDHTELFIFNPQLIAFEICQSKLDKKCPQTVIKFYIVSYVLEFELTPILVSDQPAFGVAPLLPCEDPRSRCRKIGIGSTFYRALPSTFKKFTRIYH